MLHAKTTANSIGSGLTSLLGQTHEMFLESLILMEPVREYDGRSSLISISCEGGRKETVNRVEF